MKGKKLIWKLFILAGWLLAGAGIVALLAAANRHQEKHVCKAVGILIKGNGEQLYIDKEDVMQLLLKKDPLIGRPVNEVDLSSLEKALKQHQWIKKADLYFDSRNELHVIVTERVPIARVFTSTGTSFYFDSTAHQMPLIEGMNIRLPVITNFTASKKWNGDDSAFAKKMIGLVQYINANEFWSSQAAQIHITPERKVEIYPVIGNHVINLGTPDRVEEKLNNLFLFYSQVLSKSGLDRYRIINAEYGGQVIGVLKTAATAVDSIQLKKNIESLLQTDQQLLWVDTTRLPAVSGMEL
jgi:cell division protein FtsQ